MKWNNKEAFELYGRFSGDLPYNPPKAQVWRGWKDVHWRIQFSNRWAQEISV